MTESVNEFAHPRWNDTWNNGLKPGERFDVSTPSPLLVKMVREGKVPDGRALVPGCGRGYDVTLLASEKRYALGVDMATKAIEAAQERLQALPAGECAHKGNADFRVANFFDLNTADPAQLYDFIYDYTFLCALNPSIRTQWAEQMGKLVKPGGMLLTLIFPIREDDGAGPPFAVSLQLLEDLLLPVGFTCETLELLPPELCHPNRDGTGEGLKFAKSGVGIWRKA